jgi:hypothetical protein
MHLATSFKCNEIGRSETRSVHTTFMGEMNAARRVRRIVADLLRARGDASAWRASTAWTVWSGAAVPPFILPGDHEIDPGAEERVLEPESDRPT